MSLQNRCCWYCKKIFSVEKDSTVTCPHCSVYTTSLDAVGEKIFPISLCKKCGQPLIGICSAPNCSEGRTKIPQSEITCRDKFCKSRIPDEAQFEMTEWQTDSVNPQPVCGGTPVVTQAVEQDQSSLHSIFLSIVDSLILLCNERQEWKVNVLPAIDKLLQSIPPQNGNQYPSKEPQHPSYAVPTKLWPKPRE